MSTDTPDDEIRLRAFLSSFWFAAAWRSALIVCAVLFGLTTYMVALMSYRVDRLEGQFPELRQNVSAIDARGKARAQLNDRFQMFMQDAVVAIRSDTSSIRSDLENRGIINGDAGPTVPDSR